MDQPDDVGGEWGVVGIGQYFVNLLVVFPVNVILCKVMGELAPIFTNYSTGNEVHDV